jgi:hypothetical protein
MAELVATSSIQEPEKTAELVTGNFDPAEAYLRGQVDINFYASLALPSVMLSALPHFYIAAFQLLTSRGPEQIGKILRFALGLPRGHAKTTFIKIVISWLIVYDKINFALIICANEGLAEELLSDINDILMSPNMELVYGGWEEALTTNSKELKKAFYHDRPMILAARGAGSSVRGLNIKHTRPDLIFCDDMQTRENDESVAERTKLRRWMVATLFKLLAPRGDRLLIYVGNMYSTECILYQLQQNAAWISLVTGAILEDGTPLWPELHSLESLMESYFHDESLNEANVWFAEVMNDPHSAATSLLGDPLPLPDFDIHKVQPDGVYITIDPAGFRDVSDDNVIVVHGVYNGKGHIMDASAGIKNPKDLILEALDLAIHYGASVIGVESNGYQQTLAFWFRELMGPLGLSTISVVEIGSHGRSKETRIRQFIAELYTGSYYLAEKVRAAFIWQAMKYKLGQKKNRDDLLDACAYGLDMREEYWHLIKNNLTSAKYITHARVQNNNTPF